MNIFKRITKDPEPEAFLDDDSYANGYYDDFPKTDDTVLADDSAIEEVSAAEEEIVEDQPEMREPQPMPKKPLQPAKPAIKYFAPVALEDRQKAVAKLADGYIVMLMDIDQMERSVFLRFLDYVMGAVQALEGDVHRLNKSTLVLIPYGADMNDLDEEELAAGAEEAEEE